MSLFTWTSKGPIDQHYLEMVANKVIELLDKREADKKSARVAAELDRHKKKCTHATSIFPVPVGMGVEWAQCGHCMKVWK